MWTTALQMVGRFSIHPTNLTLHWISWRKIALRSTVSFSRKLSIFKSQESQMSWWKIALHWPFFKVKSHKSSKFQGSGQKGGKWNTFLGRSSSSHDPGQVCSKYDVVTLLMIIIVYGSILRSSSNNRAALIGCHGRQLHPIIANWLCQLPTLPPPLFTRHAKVDILLDSLFWIFEWHLAPASEVTGELTLPF
jgi:hypothetical protein